MPARRRSAAGERATAFAALGDETRLSLLARLGTGRRHSISELTAGTSLTRQAVTKHLRVLQRVRMVRANRAGRENLFELDPRPIHEMTEYLASVSKRWDAALFRLKGLVEGEQR